MKKLTSNYSYGKLTLPAKIGLYILLLVFCAVFSFPLLWMFLTSVKELGEIYLVPPKWVPDVFLWDNYIKVFRDYPLGNYLSNSVWYTIISVFGIVLTSSFVAFGFARIGARGKGLLFALILSTMMLPYQVTMIPQYLLFRQIGWVDSYLPLIIPAFTGSAFIIFLLRQFYLGIPKSLDEAVSIDGGGYFTVYFRIVLPLSLPAMGTACVMEIMYRWNDLLGPLIYLNTTDKFPLALGLANFTSSYGATQWNILMAAAVVSVIPPLLLFFLAQKYFIQGIVINASKD